VPSPRGRRPRSSSEPPGPRAVRPLSRPAAEPVLVLASANAAKARELAELLAGVPYRVLHLGDFPGVVLPPEGETSYAENALGKARAVRAATGHLALADDSGIEVDALDGRPGVVSARFAGEGLSDHERNVALLRALTGVSPSRRTARYRCVVAVCAPDGREATTEGVVEGVLLDELRGEDGFGYDPLFYYAPLGATFAEVPAAAKHAVSHRGQALARARDVLLAWSDC
jgi:XTP/dITP diphosphohydrolase